MEFFGSLLAPMTPTAKVVMLCVPSRLLKSLFSSSRAYSSPQLRNRLRVGLLTPAGAGIAVVLVVTWRRNDSSASTTWVCVPGSPLETKMMKLRPQEAAAGLL